MSFEHWPKLSIRTSAFCAYLAYFSLLPRSIQFFDIFGRCQSLSHPLRLRWVSNHCNYCFVLHCATRLDRCRSVQHRGLSTKSSDTDILVAVDASNGEYSTSCAASTTSSLFSLFRHNMLVPILPLLLALGSKLPLCECSLLPRKHGARWMHNHALDRRAEPRRDTVVQTVVILIPVSASERLMKQAHHPTGTGTGLRPARNRTLDLRWAHASDHRSANFHRHGSHR